MKIVFLESSAQDIAWMRKYYKSVFSAGSKNAQKNYNSAKLALKANAYIGHASDYGEGVYEYHIPRIPFTFIYRVKEDRIEMLRVLDDRSEES